MKTKYIIYYSAAVLLLFASCKKFLDQTPISQATDATTWKSEADANTGVAGCYSQIRAALNAAITYYAYGDLVSGEFTSADDGSYQNVLNINWGAGVPSTSTYDPLLKLRLYTPFYSAIAQSNRCLFYINGMPASVFSGDDNAAKTASKNRYLGEAYFTRAFNYFYMSRIWGDVPLVTETSDASVSQQLSRSPQAVVLQQAITDANKAVEYLNWRDNSSNDRGVRADKGAAYALLAHIYAWMGDYSKCKTACDAVINSGSYSLLDAANYMDIYKGQSDESIFEIAQNSLAEGQVASNTYTLPGSTLSQPYISGPTVPNWHINNNLVTTLYADTNDVRFKKGFVKIVNGSNDFFECIKYVNIQNVNNNTAYQVALNNIIIFRLADIELLKAEAITNSAADYAGALSIVNTIRTARNAQPLTALSGSEMLNAIMDERGRELFLEGHRTFDLIRLERVTHEQQFDNISPAEFTAGKYYWPLDPVLFITNAKLKQTAFWLGKVN